MLKLIDVSKNYLSGENEVRALKNINITFRKNEFVAVLGPSGCGKTTMLNLIGGLDRYTEGDIEINGRSTKTYKDKDWDNYRNKKIGFVFQNYNLISHQSVLKNVELALTLSGVLVSERKKRATEALIKVGLSDQLHKRPSQLSGGQMQRVAIARALVNNPEIILADEPTGALDSSTSVPIMDILKEISKEKLVIMVTHNEELACKYASRTVTLLDGEITSDSNIYAEEIDKEEKAEEIIAKKKSSMSFLTALKLSFFNLFSKKGRTLLTSFAGSIGIIGIALVLSVQNGFTEQMNNLTSEAFSGAAMNITAPSEIEKNEDDVVYTEYPEEEIVYSYEEGMEDFLTKVPDQYKDLFQKIMGQTGNPVPKAFMDYLSNIDTAPNPVLYNDITYSYEVRLNLLSRFLDENGNQIGDVFYVSDSDLSFQELLNNQDFISDNYDVLEGALPKNKNEIVLIVDQFNRLSVMQIAALGFYSESGDSFTFDKIIGSTIKLATNNEFFIKAEGFYVPINYDQNLLNLAYQSEAVETLNVTGILRRKPDAKNVMLGKGFGYSPELTKYVLEKAADSNIVKDYLASPEKPLFNIPNIVYEQETMLKFLGAKKDPISVNIYPVDMAAQREIKSYIETYNLSANEENKIQYVDIQEAIVSAMNTLIDSVSYLLIAFTAISLFVSSIMIGIITYISVLERTKEIGILRSIGARKIDISRLFNAETVIIGSFAGILGVFIAWILTFPINIIIKFLVGADMIGNVAKLSPFAALILVIASIILTLIAGAIPSKIASKKDPVQALRSE